MAVAVWSAFWVVTSTIIVLAFLALPSQFGTDRQSVQKVRCFQIVVLGDIGRSPRIQYHALSIAKHGGTVQLIGYLDSNPLAELKNHSNVTIIPLSSPPTLLQTSNKLLFLLFAPLKVLLQVWSLWQALAYRATASKWMLIQNPPSIPTLAIASVICFLRGTRLVVDWHNFGYSILGMKLGDSHPLVTISKIYEEAFARTAHSHFTVTNAMRDILKPDFVGSAPVFTLHDRPAQIFLPLDFANRLDFLRTSRLTFEDFSDIVDGKTRLLVSSTSWTADEDFSVLLEALRLYSNSAISDSPQLPELLVIITGKGPLKDYYLQKIADLESKDELEMVTIKTAFLTFEDYAFLLGSADLGISLHTSSSGVDLPMKVVDMFGTGLPVLGYDDFKAWPELVTEGVDGRGFKDAAQMAEILKELFDPQSKQLGRLKQGAMKQSRRRWDAEWDPIAGKLFELT